MKIPNSSRMGRPRGRGGFVAVIVMFILLGLVLGFIAVNLRVLADLRGEMRLVERNQVRRLERASTNAAPVSANSPATNSPTAALPSLPAPQ
jgi:hypothetical protein